MRSVEFLIYEGIKQRNSYFLRSNHVLKIEGKLLLLACHRIWESGASF
jgi:hypothetical protein